MNLSPIGTAYQASRNQSFNGIGSAAQDGMGAFMDMFGQVADKRKAQVDNEVKKGLVNLMAAMQHRKALEPPKPTPVLQKQDMAPMGIALLLALLTKQKSQDIAQFGEGFMGARQMGAQNQDRYNQQVWQTQNENAQQDQRMEFERAKLGYGEAVDERNRLDTFGRENRQRADAIADDARTFDRQSDIERLRIEGRKDVSRMNAFYKGLTSPDAGVRARAAQMVFSGDPDAVDAYGKLSEQERAVVEGRQARTLTEDAMRPGKVVGQDLANDLKRIQKEWMPKMNSKKLELTDAQITNYKSLAETRPEFLRLALAKFDLGIWTAENNAGNTRFDNEIKAYKERVAPILAGHAARGKALEKARADAEEALSSSGGSEEARSALLAITQEQQKVKNEVERLTEGVPTPKSMPYTPSGKSGGMATKVSQAKTDMESRGYKVEQYGPGSIPSSKHKTGEALDLYPGKSKKTLAQVFEDVKNNSDFNYLIFNGRQYKRTAGGWAESAYSGPDPHTGHVHADYGNGAPAKATTKKTTPAKKKTVTRGNWKIEIER